MIEGLKVPNKWGPISGSPHIPPKGESRALGYSEFASLAKRVHTTGGIYDYI